MSTTTYTTTIDFDYRAERDNGRMNNTREVWRRESVIGKELANKIINNEGTDIGTQVSKPIVTGKQIGRAHV